MKSRNYCALGIATILITFIVFSAGCKPKEDTSQPAEPSKVETSGPAKQEPVKEEPAAKPAEETKTVTPAATEGEKAAADEEKKEEKIPEGKEDLVLKLGKPTMPVVKFPHKKHATEFQVTCKKCHHAEGEVKACTQCHTNKVGPDKEPTFKNAAHKTCQGCHKEQKKGPTVCTKCHTG